MKKSRLNRMMSAFLSLCMLAGLCACGSSDSDTGNADQTATGADTSGAVSSGDYDLSQVSERVFTLGHTSATGSTQDYYAQEFDRLVQEKSGGKMSVEYYNSGQLGQDPALTNDVISGVVDFEITSPIAYTTVVPEGAVFDMPFLFDDIDAFRELVQDETFFNAMSDAHANAGLMLFPIADQLFRNISTNRNIASVDDMNGMTFRTAPNEHHIAFFSALGMACTPLNTSELFLALQQGMLEGQENPWSQIYDKSLYEVQKYVTNSMHIPYANTLFMGTANWEGLTAVEQEIIWDAATEVVPLVQAHSDAFEQECLDKLIDEHGMEFIDMSNMRDEMREKTFDAAYASISGAIGTDLLDTYLAAAGYEPPAQ